MGDGISAVLAAGSVFLCGVGGRGRTRGNRVSKGASTCTLYCATDGAPPKKNSTSVTIVPDGRFPYAIRCRSFLLRTL
jgi:hypothetical protein